MPSLLVVFCSLITDPHRLPPLDARMCSPLDSITNAAEVHDFHCDELDVSRLAFSSGCCSYKAIAEEHRSTCMMVFNSWTTPTSFLIYLGPQIRRQRMPGCRPAAIKMTRNEPCLARIDASKKMGKWTYLVSATGM